MGASRRRGVEASRRRGVEASRRRGGERRGVEASSDEWHPYTGAGQWVTGVFLGPLSPVTITHWAVRRRTPKCCVCVKV